MDFSQWGLPPTFTPVRYAISDEVKNALRGVINGEPVFVSIANEGDTVSIVATPNRLFTIKTSQLGAGAAGGPSVREYPWEGVFDLVMTPMTHNLKIAVHFRTVDGRKPEVGRRAALGKPAVENLMPFESLGGTEVFRAMLQLWNIRRAAAAQNAP